MANIEDIQEEVLNELFGTTNFASTLRGLFPANLFGSSSRPANPANERPLPKREVDRKVNSANKIQQASGFLSDKSLNDVDIPTFLRQAMVKGADASKPEQAALRSTGYKVGPPGYNKYGKVGGAMDTVSAATMADAAKRKSVYANKSYASIRETQNQTIHRLLSEMKPDANHPVPNSVKEAYTYDEALINQIVEELLEAFIYDPKHHTGPLAGNKYDTLQRALDAGGQLTPNGSPMGDWNHIIVAPDDPPAKPAPVPLASMTPDEHAKAALDPPVQPLAAPVK